MSDIVNKIAGVYVVKFFDYESTHLSWVTDPSIGPRLTATIDCLAQASLQGGGRGKVIVVAHSMGGLAVQYAANKVVDGRRVADEVGLVVTIATPYTGSLLGNAGAGSLAALCQEAVGTVTFSPLLGVLSRDQCFKQLAINGLSKGSRELRELPPFPASVQIHAIAGNATFGLNLLFTTLKLPTNSDLVVGVTSATQTSTTSGSSHTVFDCMVDAIGNGPCQHNALYKNSRVQLAVANSIRQYLAVRQPKPKAAPKATPPAFTLSPNTTGLSQRTVTLFSHLTIHPATKWEEMPGEPSAFAAYTDKTVCTSAGCPSIMFVNLADGSNSATLYSSNPLQTWKVSQPSTCRKSSSIEGPVTTKVGNITAKLYRRWCGRSPGDPYEYAWLLPGKLFVLTDDGTTGHIVQAVLATAAWK